MEDKASGQKCFFTLNYDTLIEQFFRSQQIKLVDGFSEAIESEGVSYFDHKLFGDSLHPHLIKLHGSLDWLPNRRKKVIEHEWLRVMRPVVTELAVKIFEGDSPPIVLVGTHNKPKYYINPLFEEQPWHFKESLGEVKRLVICGYSFGDKAINMRLLHWLNQDAARRVVLIHYAPKECQNWQERQ